ncbi:hypothetical protein QFZ22_003766 [Streptomyces canus]|uniref:Uncharacterized protein n=1 Tax=Streptomyces canus TaxID=58343 RepID=A0AAW8FEW1_9ACTN|nr:hypothetical protein [Streptomyces canus]MDQ0907781.1 hypothetical protein [Streptomyces canus]
MGIEYVSVDAEYPMCCPVILCDICNKQLTREGVALRMESSTPQEPKRSPLYFAHRGGCYSTISATLEDLYGSGWLELSDNLKDFMTQLAHNFNTPLEHEYTQYKLT